MKKAFIAIIALVLIGAAAWHYRFGIEKYFQKNLAPLAQSPVVESIKQDIAAPPPLISSVVNSNSSLTDAGVITWTNTNRKQNGNLPSLKENAQLDAAAQAKLADMFKQQYFEHVNPQGVGPGQLATKTGYSFIAEGENLALGNFKDDQDLLTAWMNSPGHRANILNVRYRDIGVAVGQGKYQGQEVWLAVQEFGEPAAVCPAIDAGLKSQIQQDQSEVNALQAQLNQDEQQLQSQQPTSQQQYSSYNSQVQQYNYQVNIYNNKVDVLKQLVSQYNMQVEDYNKCAGQ